VQKRKLDNHRSLLPGRVTRRTASFVALTCALVACRVDDPPPPPKPAEPATASDPYEGCAAKTSKDDPVAAVLEESTRVPGSKATLYDCGPVSFYRVDIPTALTDAIADANLASAAKVLGASASVTRSIEHVDGRDCPAMTATMPASKAPGSSPAWTRMMIVPIDAKQSRMLQCMGRADKDTGRCERLLATLGIRGASGR
jgi:hypothetical protein